MFELFQMWALVEALGLVCLPLTITVFHNLPDRGWSLSKALALLVFTFCVWFPLMTLRFLPFNQFIVLGVATVILLGGIWGWLRTRQAIIHLVRSNLGYIIATEIVFLGMIFLMGWLRSFRPDIYTNEMFMDEGFIAAIMRSPHLPPNDMWMAGYSINYYYYAHLTAAILGMLLRQAPSIVFNTGISMFFGLTAVTFFGVTSNIVAWARYLRRRASQQTGFTITTPDQSHPPLLRTIPYGLFTMLIALILGNLAATQQWFQNHGDGPHFDWYAPSRVIPNTINEFPAFSFLLACFHAHVLALAFTVLAIGLAFNFLLEKDGKGLNAFGRGRQVIYTLPAAALIYGALFVINGWDYPTYIGLAVVCIILQQWLAYQTHLSAWLLLDCVTAICSLVALSLLLYLPFYLTFVSPAQGVGLVTQDQRSSLGSILLIYGLFGFVFVSLMLASAAKRPLLGPISAMLSQRPAIFGLTILVLADMGIFLFVPNSATFVIIGSIAAVAAMLIFYHINDRSHAFMLLLGAVAFALVALCEVLYLRDVFEGSAPRMNTIFKFYFQAWALLSIACGGGLYFIFESFRPFKGAPGMQKLSLRGLQGLWSVVLLLLLLAGSVYPTLAPIARYALYNPATQALYWQHDNSLDGLAYLENCRPPRCQYDQTGDYAAIRWLSANVSGDPVIVEASGGDYTEYGRISSFTGLPTIMGWSGHEEQWRLGWLGRNPANVDDLNRRTGDITQIYTSPDASQVLALMAHYKAQYLYVGPLEYAQYPINKYPGVDLHRFSSFMQVVYNANGVVIYKVK